MLLLQRRQQQIQGPTVPPKLYCGYRRPVEKKISESSRNTGGGGIT